MKTIINIYGMRRSGLHCITFDIISNFNKEYKCELKFHNDVQYKNTKIGSKSSVFLFEDQLIYKKKEHIDYNEYNVIILRDIYENVTSRIKKNMGWSLINEKYINTIKSILKEFNNTGNIIPNKILINYNKYVSDNVYRKNILKNSFNIQNISDFSKEIPHYGGGKTFKNNKNRYKIKIEKDIFNLFKNDKELLELVKQYYGYDLIKKLEQHL
jgi:hypothetical protein